MTNSIAFWNTVEIEKSPSGIQGFDEITGGGFPSARTTLVTGNAGCGKTVFALQTLVNAAHLRGEPGIFVAFEENSQQIIKNAASFGWDLASLAEEKLFFLDARMGAEVIPTGEADLIGLLASISSKVEELGARWVVFDSIDVLLSYLNDPSAERREMYRLHEWLAESHLTGILTSRVDDQNRSIPERNSFLPFMADSVVMLDHFVVDRISHRTLRVSKYRGSHFSENEFPMVIAPGGIEVAGTSTQDVLDFSVFTERVSTGIERLDTMLGGGYYRATSILITGVPGTAKSTLSGAFIEAACQRGERALYISFDETASEITRNLRSVSIDLEPFRANGLLYMYAARTEAQSAEEHLLIIRKLIEQHQPRCVVLDPITALVKAGGTLSALAVARRLMHLCKQHSITMVSTSLVDGGIPEQEATSIQISTLADTWIHLSYIIQGGERNRALTIIKSRGTRHSNQVRELILDNDGITLSDVYSAGGQVLMGTLRYQKEYTEELEREQRRDEVERKRRELEKLHQETLAAIEALKRDAEHQVYSLETLSHEMERQAEQWTFEQEMMQRLRRADAQPDARDAGPDGDNPHDSAG